MILKQILGEYWGGMDRYAIRSKGARMLVSNFGGDTVAERIREASALRSSRPTLKKVVGQIILAHEKSLADLTDEQWIAAIEIAKEEHDFRDAAYCAVLHEGNHVHLYYMRVRPDSSLVSDSQSYKKNEAAARRIERELGLPPPRQVAADKKVGDRQKTDAASRRSKRKNLSTGEIQMETSELSRLVFESVAVSKTTQEFDRELAARGVEVEWSANLSGLKLRPSGSTTWLKGSSLNRELSAAKITAALARNADLRADAERAAAVVVGTADDRAAAVTAARVSRNEALDATQVAEVSAARSLPPPAADAARALATAEPDPLSFLVPAEPVPGVLDDAPLVAASSPSEPAPDPQEAEEMARARAALQTRNEADAELDEELRGLTAKQLIELRNASKRPLNEAILMAQLIERLLQLALRVLSFGMVRKSTPMADLLASRERIALAADDEITRRHRTPHTVADRMKFLKEHAAALNSRRIQMGADRTMATLSKFQPAPAHPRVVKLKAELLACESRLEKISNDEPGVMAKMRKSAAFLRWQKDAARAKELRAITAAALDKLVDEIQESVRARAAENAAAVAAANKVLLDETEAIKIELRDRVPALQKQLDKDELQQRLRQVDPDADVNRG